MMKFSFWFISMLLIYNVSHAQTFFLNSKQDNTIQQEYEFSLEQYHYFLVRMKQNLNVVFVLQKDLANYYDTTKIVVSLRYDVDTDINIAMEWQKLRAI
ncbi:MAG: hypothetical protein U9Q83_10370 [Bacteroidota bacterium]|nr:hypothetical protein [Bacteroidota bacterium]